VRDDQIGVSYPGIFVLDAQGIVVDKRFEQSYRVRPAPAILIENLIVTIAAWLGSSTFRPYQKLRLHVTLRTAEGVHVYGSPVPEGFAPLEIAIEPFEGLSVEGMELPPPHPFRVEGIDEEFLAYEGDVNATVPFAILANQGPVTLKVRVGYQACTESFCYLPDAVTLELPLEGLDNIRD
jgi:DsbC/DsbD-like thiol-disulfide interchange protein